MEMIATTTQPVEMNERIYIKQRVWSIVSTEMITYYLGDDENLAYSLEIQGML